MNGRALSPFIRLVEIIRSMRVPAICEHSESQLQLAVVRLVLLREDTFMAVLCELFSCSIKKYFYEVPAEI